MLKELLEAIRGTAQPKSYAIDGINYTDKELIMVDDAMFEGFSGKSLETLKSFVTTGSYKEYSESKNLLLVSECNGVWLYGVFNKFKKRNLLFSISSRYDDLKAFKDLSIEAFIKIIHSEFKQDASSEKMFDLVKDVSLTDGVELKDTGITQEITIKSGLVLKRSQEMPPVTELSYRFYPEIYVPVKFLLRVKKNRDNVVIFSLDPVIDFLPELKCKVNEYFKDCLTAAPGMQII